MRTTRLDTLAAAALAAMLIPSGAAAQVRIEPSMTRDYPCATENVTRRAKTPRSGSTVVRDAPPLQVEGCTIRCAGDSDLCAWNRIPDPWGGGGFEAPRVPR